MSTLLLVIEGSRRAGKSEARRIFRAAAVLGLGVLATRAFAEPLAPAKVRPDEFEDRVRHHATKADWRRAMKGGR